MTLTTLLSLTEEVKSRHEQQLAEIIADGVLETARKNGFPHNGGWYADDFFSSRFGAMLDHLEEFVDRYNRQPGEKRMFPNMCGFSLGKVFVASFVRREHGPIEKMLLEWSTDPAVKFAIWALSELGLTARLAGDFKLDHDGSIRGSLWIEVD